MDRMEIDVERNEIWEWEPSRLQRWAKNWSLGFVIFVLAVAQHFRLNVPATVSQLSTSNIFGPSSLVADGIGRARSWKEWAMR